ncbi:MAG TPA: asparagine synthase-related protein [Candidatus Nitrosotalea sp.]|nr:asparagine synthase-related protein [Candidatus Nitrosotalea sp.]
MQGFSYEIRSALSEAVARCRTETISLSGGLDSSILASFLERGTIAYSMVAKDFASADLVNAQLVAKIFDLNLRILSVPIPVLLEAVEHTIIILRIFNPIEIRNNIVVYLTMKRAKEDGFRSMMTGDGADELFAGYRFFQRMSDTELKKDLERIWQVMHFPSRSIAKSLGVELHTPFLDPKVVDIAKSIPPELKVREKEGKKYGKWILRLTFEGSLPGTVVWRDKVAMQDGSGTVGLVGFFDNMVADATFSDKAKNFLEKDHVRLHSKESLYYYEIYRKYYDPPSDSGLSKNKCPNCNYSVNQDSHFCRMCGSYPI